MGVRFCRVYKGKPDTDPMLLSGVPFKKDVSAGVCEIPTKTQVRHGESILKWSIDSHSGLECLAMGQPVKD